MHARAVLQYTMAQDLRIVKALGVEREKLLEETLSSHRYALSLQQENADILFNTAQVLTTAAELRMTSDEQPTKIYSLGLLEQALECFNSCLSRQELEFEQQRQALSEASNVNKNDPPEVTADENMLDAEPTAANEPVAHEPAEQWVTVVEPVTASTLLETALAELDCLTTVMSLCADIASDVDFKAFSGIAQSLIGKKLDQYISLIPEESPAEDDKAKSKAVTYLSVSTGTMVTEEEPPKPLNPRLAARQDSHFAVAKYTAAFAEAEYSESLSSTQDYLERIMTAFEPLLNGEKTPSTLLSAYADALFETFISSVLSNRRDPKDEDKEQVLDCLWMACNKAQEVLALALKNLTDKSISPHFASADGPPKAGAMWLLRGDITLTRIYLIRQRAMEPDDKGINTLWDEAAALYRMSSEAACKQYPIDEKTAKEARVKEGIARLIHGPAGEDTPNELIWAGLDREFVKEVVDEMEEQFLIDDVDLSVLRQTTNAGRWLD
jgi:hypothetical protein